MNEQVYRYAWGNDKDAVGRFRLQFKGRRCRVIARGKMNSCAVKFLDTGEILNTSRNALRKVAKTIDHRPQTTDYRPRLRRVKVYGLVSMVLPAVGESRLMD